MKPFHNKVKMSHANSGAKNTNAMAVLCKI